MAAILLIDDDRLFLELVRDSLLGAGHAVDEAFSGEEGMQAFSRRPHDLVITDIVMDRGEGIEIIRAFRAEAPDLPIIAMSGNQQYLKAAGKLGATRTLLKPFRTAELLTCLDDLAIA